MTLVVYAKKRLFKISRLSFAEIGGYFSMYAIITITIKANDKKYSITTPPLGRCRKQPPSFHSCYE